MKNIATVVNKRMLSAVVFTISICYPEEGSTEPDCSLRLFQEIRSLNEQSNVITLTASDGVLEAFTVVDYWC
jgi:hypothetical protein